MARMRLLRANGCGTCLVVVNMSNNTTLGLLLLSCLAAVGCGDSIDVTTMNPRHLEDGRVYDRKHDFSLVPPPSYASTGPAPHHFMNYLGPGEDGLTVNFHVNVVGDDGTPIANAAPKSQRVLRWLLQDYSCIEQGLTTIDGKDTYVCSGRFIWEGKNCRNLQYFIRGGNGRIYVLTFASLSSTYHIHLETFRRIAQTARIG